MKNTLLLLGVMLFVQSQYACKKEPKLEPATTDDKLVGYWQVDSAMDMQGRRVRSHMLDTIHGLSPTTTKRINIQCTDDFTIKSSGGYHYDIQGSYTLLSSTSIDLQVEEVEDRVLRPKTEWQPIVVSALNDVETYRIEREGGRGSQLYLYYAHGNAILSCTKL